MLSVFQSTHSFLIGRNRKGMRPRNQMLLLLLLWEPRERLIVGAFAATEPCSLHRSADAKRNGSLENRPETCGHGDNNRGTRQNANAALFVPTRSEDRLAFSAHARWLLRPGEEKELFGRVRSCLSRSYERTYYVS